MSDESQFAQLILNALRKHGWTARMHFDDQRFTVILQDDGPGVDLELATVFRQYENTPAENRDDLIQQFIETVLRRKQVPTDYRTARARLGISLRHAGFLEQHPRVIHWDLTDELSTTLIDFDGKTLGSLTQHILGVWGVDRETCRRDAIQNLSQLAWPWVRVENIFRIRVSDNFEAARILLPEQFRALPLKGHPVVLVPDRDCLVIAGSDDVEGLRQMAATGHVRVEEGHRLISAKPLLLGQHCWEPFEPPAAVHDVFEHLTRRYEEVHYGIQAAFLRARYAESGGLHVSDAELYESGLGRYETFACFPSGGPTLLPKVDQVVLYDREASTTQLAPWADVYRVLEDQLTAVQRHPIRYRIDSFPTLEQRKLMRGTPQPLPVDLRRQLRPKQS